MKRMKLAALALSLVGILTAGNALAVDTATITVSANVLGTCSFDTAAYTMAFGAIDPLMAADATQTAALAFTCTNGSNWALDDVSGARSMAGAGANTLAYSIDAYAANLTGTGTGLTQNVAVTARITQAQAGVALVDTYNDTVTINLNPIP